MIRLLTMSLLGCLVASCGKVPLTDINAGFTLADASWFEQEQTLFFFYRVEAEQGLGPDSQIEITYRVDDQVLPWRAISSLDPVHVHLPVDCGPKVMCGSFSLKVAQPPRQVGMRLRYHREGLLTLEAPMTFNAIGQGPAHTHRSLVVYGVLDETNTRVQWRARHQFPTIRNQDAQGLGLRRYFRIDSPAYGELATLNDNPYGYGLSPQCPPAMGPLGWPPVETTDRAVFDPHELPLAASPFPHLCAAATVTDATGAFTTMAMAQKNPEVRPAFPTLRSPIKENRSIGFVLRPCLRTISDPHLSMQKQRLQLEGAPEICLDAWRDPGFPAQLAAQLRTRIDQERILGQDMVLTMVVHHDDGTGQLVGAVEQSLELVLPFERDKSSPRVSGAFVFDSGPHALARAPLRSLVLWCPASRGPPDLDQPLAPSDSCAIQPDFPELKLGPFSFNNLPILPTRPQYTKFVEKYSDAQAGKMTKLTFLAPERTPISENTVAGEFGVITFFNNEVISAAPSDAFSFCTSNELAGQLTVFRTPLIPEILPLSALPEFHQLAPQSTYGLGLAWDFPFLLRLEYEVTFAGAASAYSLTVPFGITNSAQAYHGTQIWQAPEFPLKETLAHCTRYCDHPTFDSNGVYNVRVRFREGFRDQCYRPQFPQPSDGGFPRDP